LYSILLCSNHGHKTLEGTKMEKFDKIRVERAARIYASNRDAGQALGIAPGSFGRLCRRFGIETPKARRQRSRILSMN
jgi:hypothetical protein